MLDLRSPRSAVTAMFVLNGALFGIWASRIPAFVERFALSADRLGLLLLCLGAGAILSFPLAGRLCDTRGAAQVTRWIAVFYGLALGAVALAPNLPLLASALLLFGAAHGAMDVTMNAWAAEVERHLERSVMPVFHAMWSLGAGLGAASGYGAVSFAVPVAAHFCLGALLVTLAGLWCAGRPWASARSSGPGAIFAWPRGRLALVGLIALSAAVGEGAMADWSAVFLTEETGVDPARAALGYAAFSAAMVLVRLLGARLVGRLGAARAARISGLAAGVGICTVLLAPALAVSLCGFALTGAGLALIMPLAFSRAAADAGAGPGRAIASVATLGYGGMLVGPPMIGFVARATSLPLAFGLLAAFGLAIVVLAPCLAASRPGDLDPPAGLR